MPIRCKRADKISSLHFHFELTSYFHGNITTIRIIKQIFKRNYHRIGAIIGQSCIVSVHIAKLNGRLCGAKRPHSVSEQPNFYQSLQSNPYNDSSHPSGGE